MLEVDGRISPSVRWGQCSKGEHPLGWGLVRVTGVSDDLEEGGEGPS